MKVIQLFGAPVDATNWSRESRQLARIYETAGHRPHVEPLNPELQAFADEVQQQIDERLNRPGGAFVYHVGTKRQPHARKASKPGDPDLLEALKGDVVLWDIGSGNGDFAGYHALPSYSKIVEE